MRICKKPRVGSSRSVLCDQSVAGRPRSFRDSFLFSFLYLIFYAFSKLGSKRIDRGEKQRCKVFRVGSEPLQHLFQTSLQLETPPGCTQSPFASLWLVQTFIHQISPLLSITSLCSLFFLLVSFSLWHFTKSHFPIFVALTPTPLLSAPAGKTPPTLIYASASLLAMLRRQTYLGGCGGGSGGGGANPPEKAGRGCKNREDVGN